MSNLKPYHDLTTRYRKLLEEVDGWFRRSATLFPDQVHCTDGCSHCCRGLFDITLLDALLVQEGFQHLPDEVCNELCCRAESIVASMRLVLPDFSPPWLLNMYPEDYYDDVMPDEDETPCVLLDQDGLCRIYAYRPMTCRLHGIPHLDTDGTVLFDEWCSLNFVGTDPCTRDELRFHFTEIFTQEQLLFRELTRRLLGSPVNELDTVIPAALLIDFDHLTLPEQLSSGAEPDAGHNG